MAKALTGDLHPLDRLFERILARANDDPEKSRTARLIKQGTHKCAKKLGEEAVEAALAAVERDKDALIGESSDVLFHLLVVWASLGLKPADIYAELARSEAPGSKAARKS